MPLAFEAVQMTDSAWSKRAGTSLVSAQVKNAIGNMFDHQPKLNGAPDSMAWQPRHHPASERFQFDQEEHFRLGPVRT